MLKVVGLVDILELALYLLSLIIDLTSSFVAVNTYRLSVYQWV
jgi:hypothetical protein